MYGLVNNYYFYLIEKKDTPAIVSVLLHVHCLRRFIFKNKDVRGHWGACTTAADNPNHQNSIALFPSAAASA